MLRSQQVAAGDQRLRADSQRPIPVRSGKQIRSGETLLLQPLLDLTASDKAILPAAHFDHYLSAVGQPQACHLRQMACCEQDRLRLATETFAAPLRECRSS